MTKEDILKHIKTKDINFQLFDCVTSTNDILKQEALSGAKEGTVIAALKQTNGKGRKGRIFISEAGGMYLSILVRPDAINFDTTLITSATAVAVSRAIEEISGKQTKIKWVNDILINGKKVCGILCESGFCGEQSFVVVGIGVNVFMPENDFANEIKDIATAVFDNWDLELQNRLTAKVIDNFFEVYSPLENKDFLNEYKNRSIVIGKDIYVLKNNEKISAKAIKIDDQCRLKVRYPDGSEELLPTGEISIKLKHYD